MYTPKANHALCHVLELSLYYGVFTHYEDGLDCVGDDVVVLLSPYEMALVGAQCWLHTVENLMRVLAIPSSVKGIRRCLLLRPTLAGVVRWGSELRTLLCCVGTC